MIIEQRFRGPASSGNGGYSCGVFAQLVEGDAEVTLRVPPPLDTPLRVDGLNVYDGETLVAEVVPTTVELELPEPPPHVEAGEPDPDHPFPNCFVCGPARIDGLGLTPRAYGDVVAAPWRPSEISRELVWASLDCPGAFAVNPSFERGITVLGRLAVHIEELPQVGEDLVVVGWDLMAASSGGKAAAARPENRAASGGARGGRDERRMYAGTSLFRGRKPLAWGRATWFSVSDVLRDPLPSRR